MDTRSDQKSFHRLFSAAKKREEIKMPHLELKTFNGCEAAVTSIYRFQGHALFQDWLFTETDMHKSNLSSGWMGLNPVGLDNVQEFTPPQAKV